MFKPLGKDTIREIKKSRGRFISIFAIVFIGVAFFSGVKAAAPDMKYTADKYYDDNNLMDMQILSNVGFKDEDVEKIKGISGVEGVFKTYSMDAITKRGTIESVLKIHALPKEDLNKDNVNYINQPVLVEGRLPSKSGECIVEKSKIGSSQYKIDDKIKLESGTGIDILNVIKNNTYTVVGIVTTPYYLSYEKGQSSIGDGNIRDFIIIPEADFKMPVYTEVFITVSGAKELNSYEDEYFQVTDKVKNSIQDLNKDSYHVLDRKSHYSYVDYGGAADKIEAISQVFPLFFFIVAALVCLTTMTRMVDEQRGTIGILKALGYSKGKIASKYVIYASIASLSGSILGLIVGMKLFPTVVFNAWNSMYTLPEVQFKLQMPLAVITTLIAVIITTLAAFLACYAELFETPSLLLRPKPPKKGKRIFLERIGFFWKRLSFTQKVTARNLFRYKKRFLMTVIGISGCTALLLAGFGIRDSIKTISATQYEEIIKYDLDINLKNNSSAANRDVVFDKYKTDSRISNIMKTTTLIGNATLEGKVKSINLVIPSDVNQYKDFFTLRNRGNKEEQILTDHGVIITEKLSKDLNVKIGDELSINRGEGEDKKVVISGIAENYLGHYVFMSPNYYKQIFEVDAQFNNFIIMDNNLDVEELKKLQSDINADKSVNSIYSYYSIADKFNESTSSLIYVIIVLIISAGALAFVVLYNLSNVNISERIREIATIKVLGFYNKEVSAYVYRENMILTIIGALVGSLLGIALHRFIMVTVDLENVMFGRNINLISFVYGFILTLGFSIMVNCVMYFKLRKIPMVESLKSVE